MSIADNIKQLRKQNHMTQKQLAERSGLAVITIQQYEAGKFSPKPDAVMKLCVGLNCKITDIIDDETQKYYRMFDNIKKTENIDYEHFSENSVHEDGPIRIHHNFSSEDIENLKEVSTIYKKIENGEKLTENDLQILKEYNKREELAKKCLKEALQTMKEKLMPLMKFQSAYEQLNEIGQEEAAKRVEELTEIERYTKPTTPPQE